MLYLDGARLIAPLAQASIWLLLLIEKIVLSASRLHGTFAAFVRLYSRQIDRLRGHGEQVARVMTSPIDGLW